MPVHKRMVFLPGWAFGGLAVLAAALLAPGAARAVNDCGALNSGNSFTETCPDATYTGIVYWDQANPVTLTVVRPGTTAMSATTAITAGTNNGLHNGITIRTNAHASAARNIALTVGGDRNVTIAQSGTRTNSWYNNRGIMVIQRTSNGSTTTVDIKSGVTIGSATTKMESYGIEIKSESGTPATGAGTVTLTTAANIYSEDDGIYVFQPGTGAVSVTNSGAIVTDGRGIYVQDTGSTGAITVTSSGAITSASTTLDGIFAKTTGTGKDSAGTDAGVSITHSAGAVSVASGGVGVRAHVGAARQEIDMTHGDYVAPKNEGLAKVEVTGGSIAAKGGAIEARNYEAGSVEVSVSEGVTLTSSHGHGIAASLTDVGNTSGTITVANAAAIKAGTDDMLTAARHGIRVNRAAGSGDVSVTNSGDVEANGDGISVTAQGGGGAVTVTNSGAIGTAADRVRGGISASHDGNPGADGSASLKVTHSAGAVLASGYGVFARVAAVNSAALTVEITGGSVSVDGYRPAVEAAQRGSGSVTVMVSEGATLTSRRNAGVWARIDHADNAAGRIAITQGGAVSGRTGVLAAVPRFSAMDETRAASAQPLVDIDWTGTFARGTATAENDTGRLLADDVADAIGLAREADASAAARFGQAAGIEAGVLSWRDLATEVAKGDDPDEFADADAVTGTGTTALFGANADAATQARAAAIVARFRAALAHGELATVPGAADIDTDVPTGLSDDEIETYLSEDDDDRRTLLRDVLAGSLSDKEKAVLEAAVTGGDVDAALDDADAGFSAAYKTAVKGLLTRFNVGDIRVNVNGGSINSRGDGVRAWYATPNDKNGRIDIAVAEGATVAGGMAGVWAANAGMIDITVDEDATITGGAAGIHVANAGMGEIADDSAWGRALYLPEDTTVTLRQQFVTVHGTVTGGTDAAVHLMGGGALLVGEKGKVHAGSSGRAILVNDPGRSEIVIHGEVRGGAGADEPAAVDVTGGGTITVGLKGSVMANGAMQAIQARGDDPSSVILHVEGDTRVPGRVSQQAATRAADRVQGGIVGVANNRVVYAAIDDEGTAGPTRTVPVVEGRPNNDNLPPAPTPTPPSGDPTPTPPSGDPTPTPPSGDPTPTPPNGEKDQPPPPFCDMASDDRCRLYEALPSVLLAMNGLPTREERLAAARSEAGGWARVETARGEWTADSSTRTGVAYDRERSGVRVGVDGAVGETGLFGVSLHGLRGSADMTQNGGKAELSGVGVSVSGAAVVGDGVYIDAQAGATRYDVKLTSKLGRTLKDGAKGAGYALAVEAGRAVAVGDGVTLTPRAGFVWSRVSLNDFRDSRLATAVSMKDAESLMGRAGVRADVAPDGAGGLRVFGSAEATHEFSGDTETRVEGTSLKSSPETTGARFALGVAHGWDEDRFALRASGTYATGGSDGEGFGGGLSLSVRF